MEYRRLGNSGLKVSALSFGSWVTFVNQLDERSALQCMDYAYNCGVNFFDNAEAYAGGKSEKLMGKVIKKLKWSRDSYIISSKVFWGGEKPTQRGLCKKHIHDACNAALKRMKRALNECAITGIPTTIEFHLDLLDRKEFINGDVHTKFVEQEMLP